MKKLIALSVLLVCACYAQRTPTLGLDIPASGTHGWGTLVNGDFTLLDQYLSGTLPIPALSVQGALTAPGLVLAGSKVSSALGYTPARDMVTVATMPLASGLTTGTVQWIKDGISPTDCFAGHGSYAVACYRNSGGTWTALVIGGTGGGGAASWGGITGTLSNQTDLQAALNAKQSSLGFTPLNAALNLSDTQSVPSVRTNLGLGGAAVLSVGTGAGTVAAGNDARFGNATSVNGVSVASLSGLLKLTTGAPSTASYPDVVSLWTSCSAGYLKFDGTCSIPAAGIGTVTSVSVSAVPSWLTGSVATPTSTPALTLAASTGQTSHQVLGTCGTATSFAPCSLVVGDIPSGYLYSNLSGAPTIPSNTNQLTNGAGFVTGNQSITLSGDVTGSGATSIVGTAVKVNGTTVPTNAAADQVIGTTAPATGAWLSVPGCLDSGGNHLNYNTSTHQFSCGTSGGTAGSAAFNTITSGTNAQAAMLVGTGASLATTGTGTITATGLSGVASSALSDGSSLAKTGTDINASNQVTATHLASGLPIAQGGTGATTQQAAMNALAGTQSTGKYLRSDGTNTSLTTIQLADVPTLKNMNVINVKDFGAVGNGTTDDTTAVQNALNAGTLIYFPTGTYKITATLIPKSNTKITGTFGVGQDDTEPTGGAYIHVASAIPAIKISESDATHGQDVQIDNIGIDCGSTASSTGIQLGESGAPGALFAEHVWMNHVRLNHCGVGLQIYNVDWVKVEHSLIRNSVTQGVKISPPDYTTTINIDNTYIAHNGSNGILMSGEQFDVNIGSSSVEYDGATEIVLGASEQTNITNCYLENTLNSQSGIDISGSINAHIKDTYLGNLLKGITATSSFHNLQVQGVRQNHGTNFLFLPSGSSDNITVSNSYSNVPNSVGTLAITYINNFFSTGDLADNIVRSGTDVNTSNQVTATHLAAALPLSQGGTSGTTQQAALNALTGTQSAGKYIRSDGTNATLTTIQAADVPTLNQSTTGNATTSTTATNVAGGALGSLPYQSGAATTALLAGNITTTKKFLTSTGNGSISAIPALSTIAGADLPAPSASTLGGINSFTSGSHQWINAISTAGAPSASQPASTDLSDFAGLATNGQSFTSGGFNYNFGSAAHTLPEKTGTTASKPATCTLGEVYFATDATAGRNEYYCTATNTWTQQVTGGTSTPYISLASYGAAADYRTANTASMTSGGATLTITGSLFVSGDAGKWVLVHGAGTSAGDLVTTISSFTDANHVTLAASASTTVASAMFAWATNNKSALDTALTAACSQNLPLYIPGGSFPYGTDALNQISSCNLVLYGDGPSASILHALNFTGSSGHTLLWVWNSTVIKNSLVVHDIALDGTESGLGNNPNWEMAGLSCSAYSSVSLTNVQTTNFGTPGYSSGHGGNHTGSYDGLYIINVNTLTMLHVVSNGNERDGVETQAVHYASVNDLFTANNGRFGFVAEQNFVSVTGTAGTTDGPLYTRLLNVTCNSNGGGCMDVETDDSQPVSYQDVKNVTAQNDGYDPWGTAYNAGAPPTGCFEWDMAIGHRSSGIIANSQSINFATSGTYTCSNQRDSFIASPAGPIMFINDVSKNAGNHGIYNYSGNSQQMDVIGCTIIGPGSSSLDGIYVYQASAGTISGNTVANVGGYGIHTQLSSTVTLYGNTYANDTTGNTLQN